MSGLQIRPFKIWKDSKYELFEGQISNVRYSNVWSLAMVIAKVPTIWKPGHLTSGHFFDRISNGFWHTGGHLSGNQIDGHSDYRSHSKSGPFAAQSLFSHLKYRLWDFGSLLHFSLSLYKIILQIIDISDLQIFTTRWIFRSYLPIIHVMEIWLCDTFLSVILFLVLPHSGQICRIRVRARILDTPQKLTVPVTRIPD